MTSARQPRLAFHLVALAIPVLFFILLELGLRLVDYGAEYPLFVPLPEQPLYLQPNPEVVKRFFANPAAAPDISIDTSYFLAKKPTDGLRIFVQGGSSAAGFPYGNHASPAGMLRKWLQLSFPGRTVEVVNTAMSAVNSYTLLDFADEIIAQQPDAVLIYAGHNEYLGILGVGSTFRYTSSPILTRTILWLRSIRTYQLLQNTYATLRPADTPSSGTLMANIAGHRSIRHGSALYRQGVEQYSSNLQRLLTRYRAANIPVYIATLASNEKDQPPFNGEPDPSDPVWQSRLAAIQTQPGGPQLPEDLESAIQLARDYPEAALAWYRLGRVQMASGDAAARAALLRAIDVDRLRFRAPGEFNEVIARLAGQYGATLVPVQQRLLEASPIAIGHELMLEHLHPNLDGYRLMAFAFYRGLAAGQPGWGWSSIIDPDTAAATQPVSRIEKLHGEYRVARLLHDWPFVTEKITYQPMPPQDVEQRIAQDWLFGRLSWIEAMNQGLVHTQQTNDYDEAARIALNLANAFPFEAQPQFVAGQMLVRQQPPQAELAIDYFESAVRLDSQQLPFLMTLAQAYVINGRLEAARRLLPRLRSAAPQHPFTARLAELVEQYQQVLPQD